MIKSLRKKPLRIVAIAVLPLALLGTACGSDDDGDSPSDTEASEDAPADTEASGDEESGSNAEVEDFCSQVDDFVAAMEEIMADPSSGDAAAIAAQGQELSAAAGDLAGSVDSGDMERVQECTEKLSAIGS